MRFHTYVSKRQLWLVHLDQQGCLSFDNRFIACITATLIINNTFSERVITFTIIYLKLKENTTFVQNCQCTEKQIRRKSCDSALIKTVSLPLKVLRSVIEQTINYLSMGSAASCPLQRVHWLGFWGEEVCGVASALHLGIAGLWENARYHPAGSFFMSGAADLACHLPPLLLICSSFPAFQYGHLSSSTYTLLFLAASPLKPKILVINTVYNLTKPTATLSQAGSTCTLLTLT